MIVGYIGNLGTGKTLNAVYDLIENMKFGRTVLSNTPISFDWKGKHYQSITITDLDDFNKAFINGFNIDIFMDELSIYLPSNYWNHVKPEFIYKFAQMRKFRCNLYYTEQGWRHGIKRIRDLTNWVWVCHKRKTMIPIPFVKIYRDRKTKKILDVDIRRHWLYSATRYNPEFFEHSFTDPKKIKIYQREKRTLYPSTAKRIFPAYNTYFKVQMTNLGPMSLLNKSFNLKTFEKSQEEQAKMLDDNMELGEFTEDYVKSRENALAIHENEKPEISPSQNLEQQTQDTSDIMETRELN